MRNIMRADLYRIFRGKGIYIVLAVFLFTLVMQVIFTGGEFGVMVYSETTPEDYEEIVTVDEESGAIHVEYRRRQVDVTGREAPGRLVSVTDNIIYFMLPMLVFILTADFSCSTIKNHFSSGTSRNKYFMAKLTLTATVTALLSLMYVIIPIILATLLHGFGGEFDLAFIRKTAAVYLPQFCLVFAFVCIGVFLSFAFKRTATLNTLYIVATLAPMMIIMVLAEINTKFMDLAKYDLVMNIKAFAFGEESGYFVSADPTRTVILSAVVVLVSLIGGFLLFRKAEIK
ncbi:MAG: ABC transporter permease [Oscillospiraceae bacterium]|nr:ABC transporter permease [Oscillospiraceae bacterium]